MPRLQIIHHKSYHPYNEKNKQRVREDEAKAAAEQAVREQRELDSEHAHRLNELRRRAGTPESHLESEAAAAAIGKGGLIEKHYREKERQERADRKKRDRLDFDFPSETAKRESRKAKPGTRSVIDFTGPSESSHPESAGGLDEDKFRTGGHVNFWADLESGKVSTKDGKSQPTLVDAAKRKADQEADKFTMYLERPERETQPWYADRELKRYEDKESGEAAEERRLRDRRKDARAKDRNDPLTGINKTLAASKPKPPRRPVANGEKSERERAMALLAKRNVSRGGARSGSGSPWDTPERSWAEEFERQKDLAGLRYVDSLGVSRPSSRPERERDASDSRERRRRGDDREGEWGRPDRSRDRRERSPRQDGYRRQSRGRSWDA